MPNSSGGSQPGPHRQRDHPELERRLFEEGAVPVRNRPRHEPVAGRHHAVDREGIDGLVVVEIGCAQVDEQRQAEENENGGKPAATVAVRVDRAYSFTQVTSDQILGMFTFSIEIGSRSAWARNAGQVEIRT